MNLFCYLWFRIFNNVKIYIFSRLFYAFKAVSVKILGERERVRERESVCMYELTSWFFYVNVKLLLKKNIWMLLYLTTRLTYYKSTGIKTVWNWLKKRQRNNYVYDLGAPKDFLKWLPKKLTLKGNFWLVTTNYNYKLFIKNIKTMKKQTRE